MRSIAVLNNQQKCSRRKKMKKLLILFVCLLGVTGCEQKGSIKLEQDKVYFFYQETCPHCKTAIDFINKTAPDLDLQIHEVNGSGRSLFIECVHKFDLPYDNIGTPLICMGNDYIMGWSAESEQQFRKLIPQFTTSKID